MNVSKFGMKMKVNILFFLVGIIIIFTLNINFGQSKVIKSKDYKIKRSESNSMKKTEPEWKRVLSAAEYHILREKGTERAFTGEYDGHFEEGTYVCAGCGNKIFESETKYRSGCGWPAFYNAIPESVKEHEDNSFGMKRTEITCSRCDGHLGHVFHDGPQPSGLRYCINSVSMDFKSKSKEDTQ